MTPYPHNLNPSQTLQLKLRVEPPTQIRTGHTGHLITSDTSFQPVPISCCDFGRQLQMCSCQFAPYWRTLRQGLKVSHFTNCILSPFVRRQECSDGSLPPLLSHHPSPCPLPPYCFPGSPLQPFANLLSTKNCPSLLQFPIVKGYERRTPSK